METPKSKWHGSITTLLLCTTLLHVHVTDGKRKQPTRKQPVSITCFKTGIDTYDKTLSINDAVGIALKHNKHLQATFEDIGIAQADLRQAGFYSNPQLSSVFRIPRTHTHKKNIETSLTFKISDLWVVPLRKRLAQEELRAKTSEIFDHVINTAAQTKIAYFSCLYEETVAAIAQNIAQNGQKILDRTILRKQHGYTSDFDIARARSSWGRWKAMAVKHQNKAQNSWVALRHMLSFPISSNALPITPLQPCSLEGPLAPLEALLHAARENRPDIALAQANVTKTDHAASLEKTKPFDDVHFGFSHETDFEGAKGTGPLLTLSIPLFDLNLGAIKRAKIEHEKAHKTLKSVESHAQAQVTALYNTCTTITEQIDLYEQEVIPSAMQALEYAERYYSDMRIDMIVMLNAHQQLFQEQKKHAELERDLHITLAQLELAVGIPLWQVAKA